MTQKFRAMLLAVGMILTPIGTTIGLVQQATPARAESNPFYWDCGQDWFYAYSYYGDSGWVDVYDVYVTCTGAGGEVYSYYAGQQTG